MSFTSDSGESSSDELLNVYSGWLLIADKFRRLVVKSDSSGITDFLDTILKFIRNGPKDSREFTKSISKWLIATKNLVSNQTVEQSSYYPRIKDILVIYCVLKSTNITCFDIESDVASNITTIIYVMMQGSESVTILDVLIDIEEIIRSPRSKSVMAIVYRNFLTSAPVGLPTVLDDNNFIKHLILFRAWYAEEAMSDKVNVFRCFSSTIKPTEQLRNNQSYSFLDIGEVVDHKKLLQQPLVRNALIRALRDAERDDDSQNDATNTNLSLDELLDLTTDDDTAIKEEVNRSLNLPDEIILVDDDDDDDDDIDEEMLTIGYLPTLLERMNALSEGEWRVAVLQHPSEIHDAELPTILEVPKKVTFGSVTTCICERYDHDAELPTILEVPKRVTFGSVMTRIYERYDHDDYESFSEEFSNDDSDDVIDTDADSCSCTGLYHNVPDLAHNEIGYVPNEAANKVDRNTSSPLANEKARKKNKKKTKRKKRHHFSSGRRKTSIDDWMKRKKLTLSPCVAPGNADMPDCRVILTRVSDEPLSETNSDNDSPASPTSSDHTARKTSESVMSNKRSSLPANSTTRPELRLKKCSIRLERLASIDLPPSAEPPKKIRKRKNVKIVPMSVNGSKNKQATNSALNSQFQNVFEKSIASERSSLSESSGPKNSTDEQFPRILDPVLQSANDARAMSSNQPSESSFNQTEQLICSPNANTLLLTQVFPSSEMNNNVSLDSEKRPVCAKNSVKDVTKCMPLEFVDCEIPSPTYSPIKGKRKDDNGFTSTIAVGASRVLSSSRTTLSLPRSLPSVIQSQVSGINSTPPSATSTFQSVVTSAENDADEISAIVSFIASTSENV